MHWTNHAYHKQYNSNALQIDAYRTLCNDNAALHKSTNDKQCNFFALHNYAYHEQLTL